jgi:hypothetical protein
MNCTHNFQYTRLLFDRFSGIRKELSLLSYFFSYIWLILLFLKWLILLFLIWLILPFVIWMILLFLKWLILLFLIRLILLFLIWIILLFLIWLILLFLQWQTFSWQTCLHFNRDKPKSGSAWKGAVLKISPFCFKIWSPYDFVFCFF